MALFFFCAADAINRAKNKKRKGNEELENQSSGNGEQDQGEFDRIKFDDFKAVAHFGFFPYPQRVLKTAHCAYTPGFKNGKKNFEESGGNLFSPFIQFLSIIIY